LSESNSNNLDGVTVNGKSIYEQLSDDKERAVQFFNQESKKPLYHDPKIKRIPKERIRRKGPVKHLTVQEIRREYGMEAVKTNLEKVLEALNTDIPVSNKSIAEFTGVKIGTVSSITTTMKTACKDMVEISYLEEKGRQVSFLKLSSSYKGEKVSDLKDFYNACLSSKKPQKKMELKPPAPPRPSDKDEKELIRATKESLKFFNENVRACVEKYGLEIRVTNNPYFDTNKECRFPIIIIKILKEV